ncbi:hypothetical protein BGZ63DRAFT_407388 [Mariannaea sp. PMI_226]|nr:hypothetical protein BGZ63DRAFT_407388 [Mariannaea sp. PMI_226]
MDFPLPFIFSSQFRDKHAYFVRLRQAELQAQAQAHLQAQPQHQPDSLLQEAHAMNKADPSRGPSSNIERSGGSVIVSDGDGSSPAKLEASGGNNNGFFVQRSASLNLSNDENFEAQAPKLEPRRSQHRQRHLGSITEIKPRRSSRISSSTLAGTENTARVTKKRGRGRPLRRRSPSHLPSNQDHPLTGVTPSRLHTRCKLGRTPKLKDPEPCMSS